MSYKVKLRLFEGPFDLLVYLIENSQMDIYDIPVSEITSQYLEYLSMMQEQNIEVSSEFMVLAAELIEIKSRMMLPRPEPQGDIIGVEDPRSQLAERLIAYKQCKHQAKVLKEREVYMEGVFTKPQEDISRYVDNPDEYLRLSLDDFANAFHLFLHKKRKIDETRRHYSKVERERQTIEDRMDFIRDTMGRNKRAGTPEVNFRELVPKQEDRYDIAVSFSSVLQMMRERYLDAKQNEIYGDILVYPGVRDFQEKEEPEE